MGNKERQQKRRTHKVYGKFYVNQDGEITEHVSARGGIYNVRSANWKVIKDCVSTDELRELILTFQENQRYEEDKKMDGEWRTAISMTNDYYEVLKDRENQDKDIYVNNCIRESLPLTYIDREKNNFEPIAKHYYDKDLAWYHKQVEQKTPENRTRLPPTEGEQINVIDLYKRYKKFKYWKY